MEHDRAHMEDNYGPLGKQAKTRFLSVDSGQDSFWWLTLYVTYRRVTY